MLSGKIWSVAKYEILTLSRSWFFRIFGLIALVVLFFYNLVVQTDVTGFPPWDLNAIPSGIPYTNMLWLNMAQAIIAAFLASDFLKRDKKLDTTEVIYMRSMTNVDYVLGKTLGSFLVFMGINLTVLIIAGIFNLLSQRTGMDLLAYFQYLVLISVPTLIFIMGLSYLLMSLLRNQGITFIILLGYIALTVFYLKGKVYYLFDYMAYHVPMIKSAFTGFGNTGEILIQRGIYFFTGLGFILLTIVFLKRLPQARFANKIILFLGLVVFGFGLYLGFVHVNRFKSDLHQREEMVAANNTWSNLPLAQIVQNNINLVHKGNTIEVTSNFTVKNNHQKPLEELIFSLNPGLKLDQITSEGQNVPFVRDHHLIKIKSSKLLIPGDSVNFVMTYKGNIDESVFYLDLSEKERQNSSKYYQNRYSYISPKFVLLTPESNWYPTSGVTFSSDNTGWLHQDFTRFILKVQTRDGLVPVSQGRKDTLSDGIRFISENPLPNLSLIMGDYDKKSISSDSLAINLYFKKGHDFFVDALPELKDTIDDVIFERLKDYERRINLEYPFRRFSIVEVPIQYTSFQHIWAEGYGNVQPEMVLFPEMGANIRQADLEGNIKGYQKKSKYLGNLTGKEIQVRVLNGFCALFTNESGRVNFRMQAGNVNAQETPNYYNIFPEFYAGSNYITSSDWPIFNRVLESYLKSSFADMRNSFMRQFTGVSEDEKASMALQNKSFAELLSDPDQKQIIDNIIKLKSDVLFSNIKLRAGEDAFDTLLSSFLVENRFRNVDFTDFNRLLKKNFNVDLNDYMQNWFDSKKLPGFVFSPIVAEQVKYEGMMQTMVHFKVTNPEDIGGVVKFSFRLGNQGGRMGFGMDRQGSNNTLEKLLYLEGNQTKEVSYLINGTPRAMTINTLTSKNLPADMVTPFRKIEPNKKAIPWEGEKISNVPVNLILSGETIVDNEDPEFSLIQPVNKGKFIKWFTKKDEDDEKYKGFSMWRVPLDWTLTTNTRFYGKYVRSAYYVKSGTGDRKAVWSVPIKESGYYDVYYYLENTGSGNFGRNRGKANQQTQKGKYEFSIHHDDGVDETTLSLKDLAGGWNHLGSFHFSPDTARIELSNKSEGRNVIADAVKLVRQ